MPERLPSITASETSPDLLLWADCEFTGLDLDEGHKIIEIGALVTNLALAEVSSYQSFIGYEWSEVDRLMDANPWWQGRDADRARMRRGISGAKKVVEVDRDLAELVAEHFGEAKPPLSGNSIGNDKKHIDAQLPAFASRIHYQVIDVSSLKLIAQKYGGIEYSGKVHRHFALDDVRESIDEFRFLLTRLGIADLSRIVTSET